MGCCSEPALPVFCAKIATVKRYTFWRLRFSNVMIAENSQNCKMLCMFFW